ncbi:MAG: FmdB family zinc ribbon protein, partial [Ktedonobacterales bacterium]
YVEGLRAGMPTYEYSCRNCGAHFDAWQKMSDDPIEVCPTCGGSVHRIVFPVGLMFKGSGFYSTDNRGSAVTPAAGATDTPASNTANGTGEKTSADTSAAEKKSATTEAATTTSTAGGSKSGD